MQGFLTNLRDALWRNTTLMTYVDPADVVLWDSSDPARTAAEYHITIRPESESEEYQLAWTSRKNLYAIITPWVRSTDDPGAVLAGIQSVRVSLPQCVEDIKAALRGNDLGLYILATAEPDQGVQGEVRYPDRAATPGNVYGAPIRVGGQYDVSFAATASQGHNYGGGGHGIGNPLIP